jgi:hypothetical protein
MPTVCACGLQALGFSGCYACLKGRVDWTDRPPSPNGLTEQERAYVGIFPPRPRDGWRPADGWVRDLEPDLDVDLERVTMLRYLVGLGDMTEEPEG